MKKFLFAALFLLLAAGVVFADYDDNEATAASRVTVSTDNFTTLSVLDTDAQKTFEDIDLKIGAGGGVTEPQVLALQNLTHYYNITQTLALSVLTNFYNKTDIDTMGFGTSNLTEAQVLALQNLTYYYNKTDIDTMGFGTSNLTEAQVLALQNFTYYYNKTDIDTMGFGTSNLTQADVLALQNLTYYNNISQTLALSVLTNFYNKTDIDTMGFGTSNVTIADVVALSNLTNYYNTTSLNNTHFHTASNITDFSEAVDDRAAVLIVNGTGLNWTYNDGAGTLTGNVQPNTTQQLYELFKDGVRVGLNSGISFNASPSISWGLSNSTQMFNITADVLPNTTQQLVELYNSSTQVGVNKYIRVIQGQNIFLATANGTDGGLNITINANNSTGGAGGYVNFTTNETADINWTYNFSANDIIAKHYLIALNDTWVYGNLSVEGNHSYQIDNMSIINVWRNGTNLFGGLNAGKSISNTGVKNTVWGNDAGASLDRGSENLLFGYRAGTNITNVSSFVAMGAYALEQKNNGQGSVAIGFGTLRYEDAGTNALCGYLAGANITNGTANSGFGNNVLYRAINASDNSVWGDGGFVNVINALENTGVGSGVGNPLINGRGNSFFGKSAGGDIVNGSYNIRLGLLSGFATILASGAVNNTFVAHYAQSNTPWLEGNMTAGNGDWIRSWASIRIPDNHYVYFGTGKLNYTANSEMGNVTMRWNLTGGTNQNFEFDCKPTALSGSNFTITSNTDDYTFQLKNGATVWNDVNWDTVWTPSEIARQPSRALFMNRPGPPPPTVGVEAWLFGPDEDKDLHFNLELPHDYMEQTFLQAHVHWSAELDQPGANVVWELEYTAADPGVAFANPTTVIQVVAPVSGTKIHEHTFFPEVIPGGLIERVYVCRITRKGSDPEDNYAGNAFLHITGVKYEANTLGSRTMLTK